jgi:ERCC4-related helicase
MSILNFFKSSKAPSALVTELIPPCNSGAETAVAFDSAAGLYWEYPSSEQDFRLYQFEIVKRALCYNTLVAIPTGLGKTFIAATVILNYAKWFPEGKIFFLTPTKPLCAQQLESVLGVTKISPDQAVLLTGETPSHQRMREYKGRKVFFMTPQCLENDLENTLLAARDITLVVFDEGHRASGNYSYCKIIQLLDSAEIGYRILALSATPAAEIEDIQVVLRNLNITKLEVRSETDSDVAEYLHHKEVEIVKVSALASLKLLEDRLMEVILKLAKTICTCRLMNWSFVSNPRSINKMSLLELLNRLKTDRLSLEAEIGSENISECFNAARHILSLLNGKVQLSQHGLGSFSAFLTKFHSSTDLQGGQLAARRRLCNSAEFVRLKAEVEMIETAGVEHPKHSKLVEVLSSFFKSKEDSRVIIFVQFRNSAQAILDFIEEHANPSIRASVFVGQGSAGPGLKGMAQKDQLDVVTRFKAGKLNVLIATSVGEEGLDIGEVDLIVFFDSISSPIRAIQRMGRTGRKRNGKIIVLSTEGEEAGKYNLSMRRGDKLMKFLKSKAMKLDFYPYNPRMFPPSCERIPLRGPLTPTVKSQSQQRAPISSVKRAPSQLKHKRAVVAPDQLILPFGRSSAHEVKTAEVCEAGPVQRKLGLADRPSNQVQEAQIVLTAEEIADLCGAPFKPPQPAEIVLTPEEIAFFLNPTPHRFIDENLSEVHFAGGAEKRKHFEAFADCQVSLKKRKL